MSASRNSKKRTKDRKKQESSKASSKNTGKKSKSTRDKNSTKATKKNKKSAPAEEKKVDDSAAPKSKTMVNPGPDIILPQTSEFVTKMARLAVTELKNDDNVETLKNQFEYLEKKLKQRKKDCLLRARILVAREGEDTPPICVDIPGMKHLLSNVGLKRGEADYDTNCKRQGVLDKGNELLAYESKQRSVRKTRDKTTPESIKADIAQCKKALGEYLHLFFFF